MDQETRGMFEKVLGVLEVLQTDVSELKTDVSALKTDMRALKKDVSALKTDMRVMKRDMDVLRQDMDVLGRDMDNMNREMSVMGLRQDEMYTMLKGSEESRQRMKSLEEKSSISAIEREHLKMESAKVVGALRRGATEILNGLAKEEVS